jgi:hypothetical protein
MPQCLRELSHVASKEKAASQGGILKGPGDGALRSRKDATDVIVIEICLRPATVRISDESRR